MLHRRPAGGAREARPRSTGWVEKAKAEGWYEPDDTIDSDLPFPNRDPRLGGRHLARERATRSRCSSTGTSSDDGGLARARGRRREGLGGAVLARARLRVRRHRHPRRPEDRARPRRASTATSAASRPTASTCRSPTRDLRRHLLLRDAPPRARPAARWSREMARVTKPGGVVAGLNEGTKGVGRELREPRPGGGEGARDQRARPHRLGLRRAHSAGRAPDPADRTVRRLAAGALGRAPSRGSRRSA